MYYYTCFLFIPSNFVVVGSFLPNMPGSTLRTHYVCNLCIVSEETDKCIVCEYK